MIEAIYKLYPNVIRTVGDVAYDAEGNEVAYDPIAVQAYVDANKYKELRASEYPSYADQFDMLWHAIDKGTLDKDSEFYKALKTVKETYAKSA